MDDTEKSSLLVINPACKASRTDQLVKTCQTRYAVMCVHCLGDPRLVPGLGPTSFDNILIMAV